MGRWEPDAKGRLREAAIGLFLDHGYEQTTVADIAERAGVTSRTFFRYFADKREVLFGGSDDLQAAMVAALLAAPAQVAPIAAVAAALDAAADMIGGRREFSRQRFDVINANPALRERELIKMATLATALAEALLERGVDAADASLAAEAGIGVFRVAFERWVTERSDRGLATVMTESLAQLKALTGS